MILPVWGKKKEGKEGREDRKSQSEYHKECGTFKIVLKCSVLFTLMGHESPQEWG